MRTRRLLAGMATVGLLGTLTPVATAAPDARTATTRNDTIDVGPSIEEHIADRLTGNQAHRFERLRERAAEDAAEHRAGPPDDPGSRGNGRGSKDDSPDANPGPEPVGDTTSHDLVGVEREWLALDDQGITEGSGVNFGYYEKNYRLAAVGEHIEVWVANDEAESYDDATGTYTLPFATEGDCRNEVTYGDEDRTRVEITSEQIRQLVADFDQNIHPLETGALATPPDRDGSSALYDVYDDLEFGDRLSERPARYFATGEDGGQRTVALIDNVRDANYYTPPDQEQVSYIAGFFSPFFNAAFDRNVMTIDAYDWLHRTGANPPDHGSEDPCEGAGARPFLYEGTFAHEWQHLLQSYVGGETTWVNEGLSDWVQTLTGYVDPSLGIDEPGYDSHVQCFTGFLAERSPYNQSPRDTSGPENSLTWWEDQGPTEILCDYGAAYTFMEYVYGQFGQQALQYLFGAPEAGLDGVDAMLDDVGDPRTAQQFLHDWTAMVALDGPLDDNGGRLRGGSANSYSAPTLHAFVNWDENDAYDTPGAPPNGSDYVRLRDESGAALRGGDLDSLSFTGSATAPPNPVGWTVTDEGGDAVLYSGAGNGLDHTMALPITVPPENPTLTFETRFAIEYGWDYGFVQVSTDGGQTWSSLANDLTNSDNAVGDGYFDQIVDQLPGIGGVSVLDADGDLAVDPDATPDRAEWGTATFDLSDHAGEEILLGFRYMTDGAFVLPGWWVDDITVGDTTVHDGSSTEGLSSYQELSLPEVAGWHLTILGYDTAGEQAAAIRTFEVEPGATTSMSRGALRAFHGLDTVAAVVTQDEPTERQLKYAPYELTVNGVLQPGGGS